MKRFLLVMLLGTACAETPPPRTIALPLRRTTNPTACAAVPPLVRAHHVCDRTPNPDVGRALLGEDIDRALQCLEFTYGGSDSVDPGRMLVAAARELARVFPVFHVTEESFGRLRIEHEGMPPLAIGPAHDVAGLISDLLIIAEQARGNLSMQDIGLHGNPEHVLLQGALGVLAWPTAVVPSRLQRLDPSLHDQALPRPVAAASDVLEGDVAYLRIGGMDYGMAKRLRAELSRTVGLRGVILDLRGSPGGPLTEALKLADLFLHDGCIGMLRGSGVHPLEPYMASDEPGDLDVPVVVLTDPVTASGAELVAAALRASGRALLVGEKTFGAGSVAVLFKLPSGADTRVPISELMGPDGTSFLGKGVAPDLLIPPAATAEHGLDREVSYALKVLQKTQGPSRDQLFAAARSIGPISAP